MEVDKISFYPLLLDLLTDISEAHFVAFDLELSGVASKQVHSGRQTLQERYVEIKEAAERYQILQVGLTCVTQDVENKKYVLKPYNFEISPLIGERGLDLERIFSFQSGAVDFLLGHHFDFSVPFHSGVPYLSRNESKEIREKFHKRQDKTAIADIQIKPTEVESLAFLERVRSEINKWLGSRALETLDYLTIEKATAGGRKEDEEPEELSRFEKRLVHQLVRSEYPELVTISKRGFIQIVRFNKEREDQIAADRLKELNEKINRQKGFRWVIEALHGSQITNIDLRECAKSPVTGEMAFADMDEFRAQFNRAQSLIRGNPRVMVGHNCLTDLVYIYRTFVGTLPDTVEGFQRKMHDFWPHIVDTKYMSTHNCGDINPVSSLEQIASQLSAEKTPVLELDKEHMSYSEKEALHEAGYDSFLTAQIAVRLSAKLEKHGASVDANGTSTKRSEKEISNGINGLKLAETADSSSTTSEPDGFVPSEVGGRWKRKGDHTIKKGMHGLFQYNPRNLKHRHHDDSASMTFDGGMPSLDSDFWRVYGNKLRVFGTEEGLCALDGAADLVDENGDGGVAVSMG